MFSSFFYSKSWTECLHTRECAEWFWGDLWYFSWLSSIFVTLTKTEKKLLRQTFFWNILCSFSPLVKKQKHFTPQRKWDPNYEREVFVLTVEVGLKESWTAFCSTGQQIRHQGTFSVMSWSGKTYFFFLRSKRPKLLSYEVKGVSEWTSMNFTHWSQRSACWLIKNITKL